MPGSYKHPILRLQPSVYLNVSFRYTVFAGLLVVALTFGGFGTWATIAPLRSAVVADGSVKLYSNRKKIQNLEGGVVREILVKDGDKVGAGDVLIRMDDTHVKSTLTKLQNKYDAIRARSARLVCEKNWCSAIDFPEELARRATVFPEVRAALDNEVALFEARRETREGEVSILNQKILQLEKQINGEEAQLESKRRQVVLVREELSGLQTLFDKGLTEKHRLIALQREAARLSGEVGQHTAEMARVATQVAEAQLKILQVRRSFQEEIADTLREAEHEVADLDARIAEAKHLLEQTEIRAPVSGVVVGLEVHTVGGVIGSGETILEIVPADDKLLIEARVSVRDVENLTVGQPSFVRLTAFKQRTTPMVDGILSYISADSITDERSQKSYYLVRVEVPEESILVLGDQKLQPGMPAEIIVATGERTALQYLSQPILDGLSRAWRED